MGGTNPAELRKLGAPKNDNLRKSNCLHAKVYISDTGAVVCSANASSNGIGFDDNHARNLEAGVTISADSEKHSEAAKWFDELFSNWSKSNAQKWPKAFVNIHLGGKGNLRVEAYCEPIILLKSDGKTAHIYGEKQNFGDLRIGITASKIKESKELIDYLQDRREKGKGGRRIKSSKKLLKALQKPQ